MNTKKVIIDRFKQHIQDDIMHIAQEFYDRKEHSNAHTSLQEECDKALTTEHLQRCLEEEPVRLDFLVLTEVLRSNDSVLIDSAWIREATEELKSILDVHDVHQLLEAFKDESRKDEIYDVLASVTHSRLTAETFKKLRSLESFKQLNEKALGVVEEVCIVSYVMKNATKFVRQLSESSFDSIRVFRAITVPNPSEYVERLLAGHVDRSLGINWSRAQKRAQPYEGALNTGFIRLHGLVDPEGINYVETIIKNISISYGSFEQEFVILSGANIIIDKVELLNADQGIEASHTLTEGLRLPA